MCVWRACLLLWVRCTCPPLVLPVSSPSPSSSLDICDAAYRVRACCVRACVCLCLSHPPPRRPASTSATQYSEYVPVVRERYAAAPPPVLHVSHMNTSLLPGSFAKETYALWEPPNRSQLHISTLPPVVYPLVCIRHMNMCIYI